MTKFLNKHIIQNYCLDVSTSEVENPRQWQEELVLFCKETMIPKLETLFDQVVPADQYFRLEKINMDLGEIEMENWKTNLEKRIMLEVQRIIENENHQKNVQSVGSSQEDAFIFYLKNGFLPWWKSEQEMRIILKEPKIKIERLKKEYQKTSRILHRLISNCSTESLFDLVSTFYLKFSQRPIDGIKELLKINTEIFPDQHAVVFTWTVVFESLFKSTSREIPILETLIEGKLINAWQDGIKENEAILKRKLRIGKNGRASITQETLGLVWLCMSAKKPSEKFWVLFQSYFQEPYSSFARKHYHFVSAINKSKSAIHWLEKEYALLVQSLWKSVSSSISRHKQKEWKKLQNVFETIVASYNIEKDLPSENLKRDSNGKVDSELFEKPVNQKDNHPAKPDSDAKQAIFSEEKTTRNSFDGIGFSSDESSISWDDPTDFVYTNFAGGVLLHPFLERFFESLELLEGKDFKDISSRGRAVYLLHYLFSGIEVPDEFDLPLAKVLCAYPMTKPIKKLGAISSFEKEKCDELLKAVIKHWKVLGDSSIAFLQEGFFKRQGKMTQENENWKLTVEQKAIDVLLEKLPWGIGLAKLPWMNSVLYIEWV